MYGAGVAGGVAMAKAGERVNEGMAELEGAGPAEHEGLPQVWRDWQRDKEARWAAVGGIRAYETALRVNASMLVVERAELRAAEKAFDRAFMRLMLQTGTPARAKFTAVLEARDRFRAKFDQVELDVVTAWAASHRSDGTIPADGPIYTSWADWCVRTGVTDKRERCRRLTGSANRFRADSGFPRIRLEQWGVWGILKAAKGRCHYCGSLALENRPAAYGGPMNGWDSIGRRCASIDHVLERMKGGDNDLDNLVWCCMSCNSGERPSSRSEWDPKANGGYYPDEPGDPAYEDPYPDDYGAPPPLDHGTRFAYRRGCRCPACREAGAEDARARRRRAAEALARDHTSAVHGTRPTYDRGCRCPACREAGREAERAKRRRAIELLAAYRAARTDADRG